jgi:hypothetical protein
MVLPPGVLQDVMPCDCEMADGVMQVWADKSRQEELWAPPGTCTEFFSGAPGALGDCMQHTQLRPACCLLPALRGVVSLRVLLSLHSSCAAAAID